MELFDAATTRVGLAVNSKKAMRRPCLTFWNYWSDENNGCRNFSICRIVGKPERAGAEDRLAQQIVDAPSW